MLNSNFTAQDFFFSILFIFVNESIGGKLRVPSSIIIFMVFGCSQIFLNLLIPLMGGYRVLFTVQGCTIFGAGLFTLLYTETPFFQYRKRTFGHLRRSLEYIARFNHSKEEVEAVLKQMSKDLNIPEKSALILKDVEEEDKTEEVADRSEILTISATS